MPVIYTIVTGLGQVSGHRQLVAVIVKTLNH